MRVLQEARREAALARRIRGDARPAVRAQRAGLRRLMQSEAPVAELLVQVADLLLVLRPQLQDRVAVRMLPRGTQIAQLAALLRLQLPDLGIFLAAKLARLCPGQSRLRRS
jgi:hypothetical protein